MSRPILNLSSHLWGPSPSELKLVQDIVHNAEIGTYCDRVDIVFGVPIAWYLDREIHTSLRQKYEMKKNARRKLLEDLESNKSFKVSNEVKQQVKHNNAAYEALKRNEVFLKKARFPKHIGDGKERFAEYIMMKRITVLQPWKEFLIWIDNIIRKHKGVYFIEYSEAAIDYVVDTQNKADKLHQYLFKYLDQK